MLEAMAHHLPIVSTGIFGIPELVRDGVDGILFPPRDLAALVGALDRVLSMPLEQLRRMGAAAADAVQRRDGRGYTSRYLELLRAAARPASDLEERAAPA